MHRFQIPVLASLILAVAACADSSPMDPDPSFSGVAAPGTAVTATFTVQEGTGGYWLGAGIDAASAPNGSCVSVGGEAGHYKNPAGNVGQNQNAGQCWSAGTTTSREISFSLTANHVRARSGNEQLNFGTVCDPDDPDVCSDVWVHYKKTGDWTSGKGTIYGDGYAIELASVNTAGNAIAGRPIPVTACPVDGSSGCVGGTITW
jgi:hypothetical protein